MPKVYPEAPLGYKYIFVKYYTRNGVRIYAASYGLRAFRILVRQ